MNNVEFTTIAWDETLCTTDPSKYADTRYGSRVLMGRCLLSTRSIYINLMVDTEMEACL